MYSAGKPFLADDLPPSYDRYADVLVELALGIRERIAKVPQNERPALVETAEALDAGAMFLRARGMFR